MTASRGKMLIVVPSWRSMPAGYEPPRWLTWQTLEMLEGLPAGWAVGVAVAAGAGAVEHEPLDRM